MQNSSQNPREVWILSHFREWGISLKLHIIAKNLEVGDRGLDSSVGRAG
jgi:hypothetical protein